VSTASHGNLLALVRASGGLSRQQLLDATGMSRGTLYQRLDALARLGLVYDAETLGATGGRRARRVRFEDRDRVVLAVALGQTHLRISVTDLDGRELRGTRAEASVADPAVLDRALDAGAALLGRERLVGVGVAVPATVDPSTGQVLHPSTTTIPRWRPDAVLTAVGARWRVPLVVENDARAAAVGESRAGETLVYVKLATGLGCGIVVDGEVLRGAGGVAGDIGHVRVAPDGPRCRCGRVGCLAAFCSGRALLARVPDPATLSTSRELREAADVLGAALATTVTTVNPHRLVLGGALGSLPLVVERVREQVRATAAEHAWPVVEAGALGEQAPVVGLARLVTAHVYAPAAVDALVT
jgi:predicted NBD/HSP70 family sugar kinase